MPPMMWQRENKMAKRNHTIQSNTLNFLSKTGSRNRLRIPVAGTRHTGINPGDRVKVSYNLLDCEVKIEVDPKGNYKVEKDGALRFPAHLFNLPSDEIFTSADKITNVVASF